jgi:uncharacterized protein YjbI with pentapeptide repeats
MWRANLKRARLQRADLSGARLSIANLNRADLSGANLSEAELNNTALVNANLANSHLVRSDLFSADPTEADLSGSNLHDSNLRWATLKKTNLRWVDLFNADLSEANLSEAVLLKTNFTKAILVNCKIYGISAWKVNLDGATQIDLIISDADRPIITVDNLEVAQFIYLLLNNENIRGVIDTITTKAVLILRRFSDERKAVLYALREALRQKNYLPILFDFDKPDNRDFGETVKTLALLSRFVIADITDASSVIKEIEMLVNAARLVAIQPIIQEGAKEYSMFPDYKSNAYPTVLDPLTYESQNDLLGRLITEVIEPAETKAKTLLQP